MTRLTLSIAAAPALALGFAVPAWASVADFRLPPAASQQETPPERQGPVAPDVPESRGPLVTSTPVQPPQPASQAAPAPQVTPPPFANRASAPQAQTPLPAPTATGPEIAAPAATGQAAGQAASSPAVAPSPNPPLPVRNFADEDEGSSRWPGVLGGILLLGTLGLAGLVWWRRRPLAGIPLAVPQIERPRVDPSPVPAAPLAAAGPGSGTADPLQVTLEPLRLSLTLMNAALEYRLQVANRGAAAITGLSIGADMISAHASMSREEQLAGPGRAGANSQRIERLEPGESKEISGVFRVPFAQIVPIRQGKAALLLPLARFRVEANGASTIVRTFVVGQPGEGSGLQPFRLDLGPRIYPHLAQRAFA